MDRFGALEVTQVTNPTAPEATEPDATRAGQALGDASAEIDVYVGAQYALPLPSVPEVLKRVCCDIARYRLWEDRASDEIRRRFEDALQLLSRISKGEVSLGITDTQTPAAPAAGVAYVAPARVMKDLNY